MCNLQCYLYDLLHPCTTSSVFEGRHSGAFARTMLCPAACSLARRRAALAPSYVRLFCAGSAGEGPEGGQAAAPSDEGGDGGRQSGEAAEGGAPAAQAESTKEEDELMRPFKVYKGWGGAAQARSGRRRAQE